MRRPPQQIVARFPRSTVNRIKRQLARPIAWNLDALAVLWDTDKASGRHGYTTHYARHLRRLRRSVRTVLEVGIGGYSHPESGGYSLRMWRSYFPRATIYGLDIYEKRLKDDPRIVTLQGDQSDPQSLRKALSSCPQFDIAIDDGSHVAAHIVTTFEEVFPRVAPGGLYVIEDLEYSYMPAYGGGPRGSDGTPFALIKSLVDDLQLGPRPVASLHVYPGIAFIEKGFVPGPTPARLSVVQGLSELNEAAGRRHEDG